MADTSLSWLDKFFGTGLVQDEGVALPTRGVLNFVGAGVTATDDPSNGRTNITIGQGGTVLNAGTGTLNDVSTLNAGAPAAAVRFSGASPTVNGFASGTDGRPLIIYGAGQPVTLANEATGSVAANRITTGTGGSVTLTADQGALLVYDLTSTRWRIAGIFSGALTDGPTITNTATGTINDMASDSSGTPASAARFTGVAPTLTGIVGGTSSRKLVLEAVGGPLIVKNDNTGSGASNRILTGTGADLTIAAGGAILLVYDATSTHWRVVGGTGSADEAHVAGAIGDIQVHGASGDLDVVGLWTAQGNAGRLNADWNAGAFCTVGAVGDTFPTSGLYRVSKAIGVFDFIRGIFTLGGVDTDTQVLRIENTFWNLGVNGLAGVINGGSNVTGGSPATLQILGGTAFSLGGELALGAETLMTRSAPSETNNATTITRTSRGLGDATVQSYAPAKTATTDATQTTIATGTMDLGCNEFTIKVLCTDLANGHSAVYNLAARGHWTGSVGTINDLTNGYNSVDATLVTGGLTSGSSQTTVTLTTSGATWSLKVTGGASLSLHWAPVVTRVNNA